MSRHLLDITDLSAEELRTILHLAQRVDLPRPLEGLGVALIFEKPSNRTRQSMEMAVFQLGGHPAAPITAGAGNDDYAFTGHGVSFGAASYGR